MSDTISSFMSMGQTRVPGGVTSELLDMEVEHGISAPANSGFFGNLIDQSKAYLSKNGVGAILGTALSGGSTILQIQQNQRAAEAAAEEYFFEGRQALLAERAARVAGREEEIAIREQLRNTLATLSARSAARGGTREGSTAALLDFTAAEGIRARQNVRYNTEIDASGARLDAASAFAKRRSTLERARVARSGLLYDFFDSSVNRFT